MKKITIYTRTTCPACVNVKKYLDMKGHAYDVINLDTEPDDVTNAVVEKSGARTVPVIFVKDEEKDTEHIAVGWNPMQLATALAA